MATRITGPGTFWYSVPHCYVDDSPSTFCIRQVSLLISLELLIIPPPTTSLPFPCDRFVTLLHRRRLPCLSPWETPWVEGFARRTVKGSPSLGSSPTGLAETSSLDYGLIIHLRLLSTFPHGNAVTTVGFRAVTLPWTGLAPVCSNAFTGALAHGVSRGAAGTTAASSPGRGDRGCWLGKIGPAAIFRPCRGLCLRGRSRFPCLTAWAIVLPPLPRLTKSFTALPNGAADACLQGGRGQNTCQPGDRPFDSQTLGHACVLKRNDRTYARFRRNRDR